MDSDLFKQMNAMPDEKLFEFVTEVEHSQKRHAAMHILEIRRTEPLRRAAEQSADAARASAQTARAALTTTRWAMIAAFLSAIAAFIALLHH
jgi:hypothetical protein